MIFAILVICYLIGSIPTAYLLVKKLKGVDIRTVGSGNVGASNASRVLGRWGFVAVLTADALKGLVPVLVLRYIYGEHVYVLLGAVALVLGHSFTVFLNFKGGKGVATGLGIFIALAPYSTLIAAAAFGVMIYLFRMISLSSITAAFIIAVSVWFLSDWAELKYFTVVIAALVIFLHRSNIVRIMNKTERKIGTADS